jgi:SAM-dependent methyltransferase
MRGAPRYASAIFSEVQSYCPSRDSSILDFGAGDGVFVEKFHAERLQIDCIEPDLQLRSSLLPYSNRVFEDVSDVPANAYDFVYTVNVVEHIVDLDQVLIGIRRVMKPNAVMFVFTPAFNLLWSSLDDEIGHVQRFTRRTLRGYLGRAGFQVVEMRYFDSLGFPAALTVRLLERVGLFRYSSRSIGFYDRYLVPLSLALDRVTSGLWGKNVIAIVRNPGPP